MRSARKRADHCLKQWRSGLDGPSLGSGLRVHLVPNKNAASCAQTRSNAADMKKEKVKELKEEGGGRALNPGFVWDTRQDAVKEAAQAPWDFSGALQPVFLDLQTARVLPT